MEDERILQFISVTSQVAVSRRVHRYLTILSWRCARGRRLAWVRRWELAGCGVVKMGILRDQKERWS